MWGVGAVHVETPAVHHTAHAHREDAHDQQRSAGTAKKMFMESGWMQVDEEGRDVTSPPEDACTKGPSIAGGQGLSLSLARAASAPEPAALR